MAALSHPNGRKLSDGQIAEHCGVSQPFVTKLRAELTHNRYESGQRLGRDGTTYECDATANIGKAGTSASCCLRGLVVSDAEIRQR